MKEQILITLKLDVGATESGIHLTSNLMDLLTQSHLQEMKKEGKYPYSYVPTPRKIELIKFEILTDNSNEEKKETEI